MLQHMCCIQQGGSYTRGAAAVYADDGTHRKQDSPYDNELLLVKSAAASGEGVREQVVQKLVSVNSQVQGSLFPVDLCRGVAHLGVAGLCLAQPLTERKLPQL